MTDGPDGSRVSGIISGDETVYIGDAEFTDEQGEDDSHDTLSASN